MFVFTVPVALLVPTYLFSRLVVFLMVTKGDSSLGKMISVARWDGISTFIQAYHYLNRYWRLFYHFVKYFNTKSPCTHTF